MKKIIPLKKQLEFKTNVSEITSIALENTLHNNTQLVEGSLIINGTYRITDTSTQVDEFEFEIPINIEIDNKYITDNMIIDINDFYYKIINNNILEVNIEILLDNIIEKEEQPQIIKKEEENMKNNIEKQEEQLENKQELKEERCIEEENETYEQPTEKQEKIEVKKIFQNFTEENEDYSTYHIYIVREGDNIDTIMTKYSTTKEILSEYNNINELKIGDKIIIPEQNNVRN